MPSSPRETQRDLMDRRLCVALPQRQIHLCRSTVYTDYITIVCEQAQLCEFCLQNNFPRIGISGPARRLTLPFALTCIQILMSPRKSEAWKKRADPGNLQEMSLPNLTLDQKIQIDGDTSRHSARIFQKMFRTKMYAKEMPIVSISNCRIFLFPLQGFRLDTKIKFRSSPLIFFISSLGY